MRAGDDQDAAATPAAPSRPDALPPDAAAAPRVSHRDGRPPWLWGGGVLLSAGIVIGLFWLGTMMAPVPAAPSPGPSVTPDSRVPPSASPSPTVTELPDGPVAPGEYAWDQLRGGECLQPFDTPWAETFTVVGCETPHAAQLVFVAAFDTDPAAPYPGADALSEQLPLLCGAPDVIDVAAAEDHPDIQVEGTYPLTPAQWDAGQRNWSCFVSRAGGEPIESSLAAG